MKSSTATGSRGPRGSATEISLAAIISLLTAGALFYADRIAKLFVPCFSPECDAQQGWKLHFVLEACACGIFLITYLLIPTLKQIEARLHSRWRREYSTMLILGILGFFSAFIFYFGNKQFGGWDFSILVETGWRQWIGQRPYTDFISTNPAGFNLGLKWAFDLMGPSWNTQIYATAMLACGSFLWIFWLLARITRSKPAALFVGFAIECIAVLSLDFWWYNNVTALTAAIFFLSCVSYLQEELNPRFQISYAVSLALLGLMKPNVAGLLGLGGIALVFFASRHRLRLVVWTLGAVALSVLLLVANHVSIRAMLASYAAAAIERGRFSNFGFIGYERQEKLRYVVYAFALATPAVFWFPSFLNDLKKRDGRAIARDLLFVLAPLVSIFAMFTNGELKEVEFALFIAAGSAALFHPTTGRAAVRRLYVASLSALVFSALYLGSARIRVLGIGSHAFFEWDDPATRISLPFFKDLRASTHFGTVTNEMEDAISTNHLPLFLGPRLEFGYAAFGLPSPRNLPLYWQPGTSFARSHEPALLEAWRNHKFAH